MPKKIKEIKPRNTTSDALRAKRRRRQKMIYGVKLHLGCGKRILPSYINIDIQKARGVDLVCDVRKLPYRNNSVDFIYSCAVIEHFGRDDWKKVLSNWFSKLKPGGKLRISTADFRQVCERYFEKGNIEELLGLVVGGQKDKYDWHGMIFDFKLMKRTLKEIGFKNIKRYDWRETDYGKMGFDDYSQAYLPHMQKEHGRLMMLNVEAQKPL